MPDLTEFHGHSELVELQRINRELQAKLVDAKNRSARLVEATFAGARDAMLSLGPTAAVKRPKPDRRATNAEVALWHLTDWQGSKNTTSYNSRVMRERVLRFVDKAETITDIQRAHHPVRDCTICFGGDMVEGLFNFPSQPFEVDATIFEQFVTVSRLVVDVVRRALGTYDTVTVVGEWGNHGRLGSKRAVVPRSDNVDRMVYEMSRQLLSGEDRLTWNDCPEDIQRVEIGNYRALSIHGDEIGRNGFASPTTIAAHAARWQSGAYPWAFRDVLVGHYHNHMEMSLPNGRGSVYFTGSTESDNRYARDTMAASAIPSQRLHFVDPVKGRVTAAYKVWLDDADVKPQLHAVKEPA